MRRKAENSELVPAAPPPEPGTALVTKAMFMPFKLVSRRLAPRLSRSIYTRLWSVIDKEAPPPRAEERQDSVAKLALALGLEGALVAIVNGLLDHASRRKFAMLTGRWPGKRSKS